MSRFKVGDIIINKWASDRNPLRKSMYIGFGFVIAYYQGHFHKTTFIDMEKDTEHFIVIGHEPIVEQFKELMDKYKGE